MLNRMIEFINKNKFYTKMMEKEFSRLESEIEEKTHIRMWHNDGRMEFMPNLTGLTPFIMSAD